MDLNGDGKIDKTDESIRQQMKLAPKGSDKGGTSHYATFLLQNNSGTQVFTKNGWFIKWQISYQNQLPSAYGNPTGINNGSSTFTLKK